MLLSIWGFGNAIRKVKVNSYYLEEAIINYLHDSYFESSDKVVKKLKFLDTYYLFNKRHSNT